ncbi:hypothetical protein PR048_011393 [Dryococelus australis]|uniref:Uncharacterized protein n=1 Tax=Dryococelus australis TaxID=614101 RepID=A0ABQ9HLH9_9NEOP|nr:hypothetical protein PR048_011393 [Dryococelus australis]
MVGRDRRKATLYRWGMVDNPQYDGRMMTFLRGCKFSLEKTKRKLDMYFTMRAAIPEFFTNRDVKRPELQDILKIVEQGVCYNMGGAPQRVDTEANIWDFFPSIVINFTGRTSLSAPIEVYAGKKEVCGFDSQQIVTAYGKNMTFMIIAEFQCMYARCDIVTPPQICRFSMMFPRSRCVYRWLLQLSPHYIGLKISKYSLSGTPDIALHHTTPPQSRRVGTDDVRMQYLHLPSVFGVHHVEQEAFKQYVHLRPYSNKEAFDMLMCLANVVGITDKQSA